MSAIANPGQFLRPDFVPTDDQLSQGIQFYLAVVAASLVIYGVIAIFVERGSLEIKAKMLAMGLLGIFSLFLTAIAAHFPLWLLGGRAAFSGTLLTYIYTAGPYGPLLAIGQWVLVAGLPARLRPGALSPSMAQQTVQLAVQDPETDKIVFFTGSIVATAMVIWATFQTFRWLSFVHDLGGWRLAVAIVLWFLIAIPVGKISQSMASVIHTTESKPVYGD